MRDGCDARKGVGSSPRVRGTPRWRERVRRSCRFIPAGAGNAFDDPRGAALEAVHPRGCGERLNFEIGRTPALGSSPRVRGTLDLRRRESVGNRFIPAGAGNAASACRRKRSRPVHPRGCGERTMAGGGTSNSHGSSPRVRGTPAAASPTAPLVRFIPAGAGNASGCPWRFRKWSVHPRGCGERQVAVHTPTVAFGSSPRVRGTPEMLRAVNLAVRFIPAGAGNALARCSCFQIFFTMSNSAPAFRLCLRGGY